MFAKLFLVLSLLLATSAHAALSLNGTESVGNAGASVVNQFPALTYPLDSDVVNLGAGITSTTANDYYQFRSMDKPGAAEQYEVPYNLEARCTVTSYEGGGGMQFQIGCADVLAAWENATATHAIAYGGDNGTCGNTVWRTHATASTHFTSPHKVTLKAGCRPYARPCGNAQTFHVGLECVMRTPQ